MWQGTLALKNDSCAVQMHVISGFNSLVQTALPQQIVEGTCQPLRIAQRMRLEAAQLEGVIKRMQVGPDSYLSSIDVKIIYFYIFHRGYVYI